MKVTRVIASNEPTFDLIKLGVQKFGRKASKRLGVTL
jgi:hypothetical protein